VGRYIFGDFSSSFSTPDGTIFVAEESEGGEWDLVEAGVEGQMSGRLNRFLLGLGQDTEGEIYLLTATNIGPTGTTGEVLKIVSADLPITIDVENFRFDADNNNNTQVDTVTIEVGDTVRWIWRAGIHTVTSGEGSSAPDAGELFDAPSDGNNQSFSYTFTEAGTVPYFCRPHDALNMKGVIIVQ
jgi:plastocyanin